MWVSILSLKEWYLLGSVLGFLVALAVTFALQKYWTFRDFTKEHMKRQFFSYTAVAVVSLGLNLLLLHLSKLIVESFDFDFFHTWYLVAQIAIIVLLAGCSFLANYFLTFRPTV